MPDTRSRFSLRALPVMLDKIKYIAEIEGDPANKLICALLQGKIEEYENIHGEIPPDELSMLSKKRIPKKTN